MKPALAAQRRGAKRGSVVSTKTVPAPVGGLNSIDAIANMKPTDAVLLDNLFPSASDVSLRKGYDSWATGIPGSVETLAAYRAATVNKLFAFAGSQCFDATTRGDVGDPLMSGLRSTRMQTVNFGTPGGHFLYAVNGVDDARLYDGTRWRAMNAGTGETIASMAAAALIATVNTIDPHGMVDGQQILVSGATPAAYDGVRTITSTGLRSFTMTLDADPAGPATVVGSYVLTPNVTGADTSLFDNVAVFGQRIWFTQRASFKCWYLPVTQIGGALTELDLSSLFAQGGSLMGVVDWTVAGDQSTKTYAAFVSTEGEVALYAGYDPDNADNWSLAGIARVGRPIGKRFWTRLGADIILLTVDGFVPLSKAVLAARSDETTALSYKISPSVAQDVEIYGRNFGWQVIEHPIGHKLIVNVPTRENDTARQYVQNTETKAWCRYIGLDAACWETLADTIYFGGAGAVYVAESGYLDIAAPIVGSAIPAYSYFGAPSAQKKFTLCRPVVSTQGPATLAVRLATDFSGEQLGDLLTLDPERQGLYWDFAWNGAWSDAYAVTTTWRTIGGFGFAGTVKMGVAAAGAPLSWQATSFVYEVGGLL